MKEVTYEDWQKNPTQRVMWVWDEDPAHALKRKVLYISKTAYPVLSIRLDDKWVEPYKHCTEIEKPRRMTNKELSRWLREKPTREYKYKSNNDDYVYSYYEYKECYSDEKVNDIIIIRENDEEWREPLVEEEING